MTSTSEQNLFDLASKAISQVCCENKAIDLRLFAFSVLAAAFTCKEQSTLILEGHPILTDRIARDVLSLFPSSTVMRVDFGRRELSIVRNLDCTRVLYIPDIERQVNIFNCIQNWSDNDGFWFKKIAEKTIHKVIVGKVAVLATCQDTKSIRNRYGWFFDKAWTLSKTVSEMVPSRDFVSLTNRFDDLKLSEQPAFKSVQAALVNMEGTPTDVELPPDVVAMSMHNPVECNKIATLYKSLTLLRRAPVTDDLIARFFWLTEKSQELTPVQNKVLAKVKELTLRLDKARLSTMNWIPSTIIAQKLNNEKVSRKTINRALAALCAAGYLVPKLVKNRGIAYEYMLGSTGEPFGLNTTLDTVEDRQTRRAASQALDGIKDPAAVPMLITALMGIDARARRAASKALVTIGSISVPALVSALKNADVYSGAAIVEVLGKIKDPAAVPSLIARLKEVNNESYRKHIAHALLTIDNSAGKKELLDIIVKLQDIELAFITYRMIKRHELPIEIKDMVIKKREDLEAQKDEANRRRQEELEAYRERLQ